MSRTFRWIFYTKRQRDVAIGFAFGSAAAVGVGVGTYRYRRPLLADSGSATETKPWNSKDKSIPNPSIAESGRQRTKAPDKADSNHTPPPQTKGHATFDSEGDDDSSFSAWDNATNRISEARDSFTGWDFGALREKITEKILPAWIKMMPEYIEKLQNELSGAPWSLSWEIWEDAHDPQIHPEIMWDARVRLSKELCADEQTFLSYRRKYTTKALAKYLDVPESEIHPDDVPIIGLCGSGGGLRALVAGASSALCAQQSGLFDCVTYTSGVSGSCWLQTLFNSSIGQQDYARIIDHLKQRINIHIAYPPAALKLLSAAPTNKFLLSGYVEKLRGVPDADFGLVDVYGLLLAARLMVPKGELNVSDTDLKVSNQRYAIEDGNVPLPIYTAVRHEIPKHMKDHIQPSQYAWYNTKHYDFFEWFEWSPFEFFCEAWECGIPTWAVGRKWDAGKTQWRENGLALPELRIPLYLGIWGSAFCATLSHYYKEIRPILRAAGLDKLDTLLSGRDDDLVKVHPIDPAVIPNFALGLKDRLPDTVPESVHEAGHLQLMDAGMSNNLPIYPLLRPGRDVDVIVAFDASADVKNDNWVKVADGYARQRGIKGWPMGAGWPPSSNEQSQTVQQLDDAQAANAEKVEDALEGTQYAKDEREDLGYCNVWVGTIQESHEFMDDAPSRRVRSEEDESHLTAENAGITLIYMPFMANEKVPGVDPMKSDFMSTWNFVYTPEEIDKVVALARANFEEGKDRTRRTIRAIWQRKKMLRLQREEQGGELTRRYRFRDEDSEGVDERDQFNGN